MNILFLSQRVPEPPNKGDKIRSHHFARRLAARHAVHLACLADDPAEEAHVDAAKRWAASVTWRQRCGAESAWRAGVSALTGRPLTAGFFRSGGLSEAVRRARQRERFDVLVAYCSGMAGYVEGSSEAKVLDLVDVDSEKWKEYARRAALPARALYGLEHRLLRGYEKRLVREFDRAVLISVEERDMLARFADVRRVAVVSNGVDAEWLARPRPRPRGTVLSFIGALDYFANVDGIVWFAREVFPEVRRRVPGATLRVVGRRPVPAVRGLSDGEGVEVVGEVADMRPELWSATLAVAPLRIAPGIQNKVLEAMAAGTPVVATRAALRSLVGRPGEHYLAADGAEEFAAAVSRLVERPDEADAMAARALALVRDRYSWDQRAREYETVLEEAVAERRSVEARGGTV
ncbi:MAG: TIGR03087 family PEP-CTERM/XrtA system glycosyltransferase [Candidatus Eiseniibacteriota bacterium]